jgi:hypothetical protein
LADLFKPILRPRCLINVAVFLPRRTPYRMMQLRA